MTVGKKRNHFIRVERQGNVTSIKIGWLLIAIVLGLIVLCAVIS